VDDVSDPVLHRIKRKDFFFVRFVWGINRTFLTFWNSTGT